MADDRFDVNLFRPRSDHARFNMKTIFIMLIIWGTAVFGFQFLLIALQKPVAEPTFNRFEKVWSQVKAGEASNAENREFARSLLMVLGKNIVVKPLHKATLSSALNSTLRALAPRSEVAKIDAESAAALIELKDEGFDILIKDMLPTYVKDVNNSSISAEIKADLPGIMKLYLVHNQSVLTDTKFMGFPFHYWYTAQFLLILFVFLCLVYAKVIDSANKKFDFKEEE